MVVLPPNNNLTIEQIDRSVSTQAKPYFSATIGGSTIGHVCERHLWYRFRWVASPEIFDGRKLRLFETGHLEEARMVGWLRKAGIEVWDVDPATGRQWQVLTHDGHFKGYVDGKVIGLLENPVTPHLLECKTHNKKSFEQLQKYGVAVSKPDHLDQMQSYMHLLGLTRAFYLAKGKDDDALYSEIIHYNEPYALALMAKAKRIIQANHKPSRVSDNPDYFLCKAYQCPHFSVCHEGAVALRNCRTCLHSSPSQNGKWHCNRRNISLTYDAQMEGCSAHLYLPSLVNGDQIDADETAETVTYRMADGQEWVDGEHS